LTTFRLRQIPAVISQYRYRRAPERWGLQCDAFLLRADEVIE
jgi:hypothetical protein